MAKIPRALKGYVKKGIFSGGYHITKSGYIPPEIIKLIDETFYRSKWDGLLYPKNGKEQKSHWSVPSEHESLYFS